MLRDISPPITPSLAVWPGDTPPTREILLDHARGDRLTLSTLHATVHLGAHADGPNHYQPGGASIDERDLDLYLGPCQVVRIEGAEGRRIGPDDLRLPIVEERVLFATGTYPDPTVFRESFAAIEPALVEVLHQQGVRLIGIDTPSVDLHDDESLQAHRAIAACDIAIVEGLVLDGVPEGRYELIALPLGLVGFDASPVRAVLRDLPGG